MRFTLRKTNLVATAAMASLGVLTVAGTTLVVPAQALAQETAKQTDSAFNGIVVSGTGEVQVKPDIARIQLGVQNQGREGSGVAQENAQKTDALIKAVKAAGVADKDIRTSGYSIYPQYDYFSGPAPDGRPLPVTAPPKIAGYQASNMVTVTVRKIADSGKIIDAAIKAGGNAANGISFDVDDSAPSQDAALAKAVADAMRKAKVIAKAAGISTISLAGIQESSYSPPRPMFRAAMQSRGAEAVSTPIQPGEESVTANVSVRFLFGAPVPVK